MNDIAVTATRTLLGWAIVAGALDTLLVWKKFPCLCTRHGVQDGFYSQRVFLFGIGLCLLAVAWVLTPLHSFWSIGCATPLLVMLAFLAKYRLWGWDGADQMLRLALFAWMLGDVVALTGGQPTLSTKLMGAAFAVCYLVSGIAKLSARSWRGGDTLAALATTSFWRLPDRPLPSQLFRIASWLTIGLEILLPFSLLSRDVALVFAVAAVCFHFGIAAMLGLWSFAWVFVAYAVAFANLALFLHSTT